MKTRKSKYSDTCASQQCQHEHSKSGRRRSYRYGTHREILSQPCTLNILKSFRNHAGIQAEQIKRVQPSKKWLPTSAKCKSSFSCTFISLTKVMSQLRKKTGEEMTVILLTIDFFASLIFMNDIWMGCHLKKEIHGVIFVR